MARNSNHKKRLLYLIIFKIMKILYYRHSSHRSYYVMPNHFSFSISDFWKQLIKKRGILEFDLAELRSQISIPYKNRKLYCKFFDYPG